MEGQSITIAVLYDFIYKYTNFPLMTRLTESQATHRLTESLICHTLFCEGNEVDCEAFPGKMLPSITYSNSTTLSQLNYQILY